MIQGKMKSILIGAINKAETETFRRVSKGRLNGEENITAALLALIESKCSDVLEKYNNVSDRFQYEVISKDFPKNTMEPVVGADFAISLRKFNVWRGNEKEVLIKSLLVQAKLPSNNDYGKLKEQIGFMERITKESYVAVYDVSEDRVFLAKYIDVIAANYRASNVPKEKRFTLGDFFSDIFVCKKAEVGFDASNLKNKEDVLAYIPGHEFDQQIEFIVKEAIE
ncbi:hypothetical protein PCCS19_21100 [Paenibacillus sp. CCS19]|uniref:hypothetical protein n=1 Tax=Paenibacillus sp. CCS19 TaxID=3158387 RepID=UPI0025617E7B|nr:hypothetical protein [Paenibacillus cellulosilyticus]GMK39056.1 hypothetical protein PCCS19_21100 [Paenibacillus cellulosilyticus]